MLARGESTGIGGISVATMGETSRKRQDRVLRKLLEKKHISVKQLAEEFRISEATARRDLKALAETGQLMLVHGGARLPAMRDFSFQAKKIRNIEAKRIIGRLAAELVADGDQVFLDSGTTCFELAVQLQSKQGVTVLANSARFTQELSSPSLLVFILGGRYRPDRLDMVGPMATQALTPLRGFIAFIGADGLSREPGPAASDMESAELFGLATRNARETVLLVDHDKFDQAALCQITSWSRISTVVSDRRPNQEWIEFFSDAHIKLIYPNSNPSSNINPT